MSAKKIIGFAVGVSLMCIGCVTGKNTSNSQLQAQAPVQAQCEDTRNWVSIHGNDPLNVVFFNSRAEVVKIYWVNYNGDEELKATVPAKERYAVNTYATHPWIIRDESGTCIESYNGQPSIIEKNVIVLQ